MRSRHKLNTPTSLAALKAVWKLKNEFFVEQIARNTSVFQFLEEQDASSIMEGRHWLIQNHLINMQCWPADKPLKEIDFTLIPFWIHTKDIPPNQIIRENAAMIESCLRF
ncbi:conserved hypothetical protein [Ricinus communis]|uniref:DUF4283 domain-containing protein n=1 Tax=Ricinus communis TaxID=3988 RepID=B9SCP1_RICCO|nr:conserved hypothetical protein [Ricinus communis]